MSDDRRMDVLRAIVQDYVSTAEPVGSRALVERHRLGVSPATVRNDMAALEEAGLIAQPHTSAGRIPTDAGYRIFVDQLAEVKPLSQAERNAIATFMAQALDLDDVVDKAVRVLAQLTGQLAVVQYPALRHAALRHLELVVLAPRRVLMVVITDAGRVEQRLVELDADLDEAALHGLRDRINAAGIGKRGRQLREALAGAAQASTPGDGATGDASHVADPAGAVIATLERMLSQSGDDRLVMAGTSNLARGELDVSATLRPVLEAIEEQVVLLRLFTEMSADAEVAVRIGHENPHEGFERTSVVAAGYGERPSPLAHLAVVGPTRMDYPSTMAAVRAVARYLSRILTS